MTSKLRSLYGLKWNPFSADLPTEALVKMPRVESFLWRIEQSHVHEGGFALVSGDPGTGKSVVLRLVAERLERLREVTVAALAHPQSNIADFYREMGDLFGVPLRPHNRWGGFKALRERFVAHIDKTLMRPVLLIDEAQEMSASVLAELRILASTRFDSRTILSVVLAGDARLTERLRSEELLALGSRLRTRLALEYAGRDELRTCLEHRTAAAGNAALMTPELIDTLSEHAVGNYRVLVTMAGELLTMAAERELERLDEKLYFDVFAPQTTPPAAAQSPRARAGRRRGR